MRIGRIWAALVVVATLCAAAPVPDLSGLAWLEGSWIGVEKGLGTEEHWTSPAGGGMVGMHKEVRGERMTEYEFLRIGAFDDGTPQGAVAYFASPGGAIPTAFKLIEIGPQRAIFENPEHDFPQRVVYWMDEGGLLHARIEGLSDGRVASIEWTWKRR
jgi:hypothetical protein